MPLAAAPAPEAGRGARTNPRWALAERVSTALRERYGPVLQAIGVHGAVAHGDDTDVSDVEIVVVTRRSNAGPAPVTRRIEGVIVDLSVITADKYLRHARTLTTSWPLVADQYLTTKPLHDPDDWLPRGRTLILPQWPTYTVRPGDTVSEIALAAHVDMPSLLLLNYIPDPNNLRAGQVLILPELPDGGMGPAPAAQPSGVSPARPSTAPPAAPPPARAVTSTAAATGAAGRFGWPIQGEIISDFGPKGQGQRNDGVNIRATEGAPVRAAAAGTVEYAGNELPGYGELVLIKHDDGWITAYAHNRRLLVTNKQRVQAGETIAEAGRTGSVTSPQLHFEVRNGVTPVDPMRYLPPA